MADSMWLPTLPLHLKNYVNAWFVMNRYILNSVIFVAARCCQHYFQLAQRLRGYPADDFLTRARVLFHRHSWRC